MDAPAKKSAFQRNLEALVAIEEPDPQHRTAHLARRLERSRQTAHDYLTVGTNSILAVEQIAEAFNTTVSAMLDSSHEGYTRIDNARMAIGGTFVLLMTVYIEPMPAIPPCEEDLVVYYLDGVAWAGPFSEGPRTPAYAVRWIEGVGDIAPRNHCQVSVYVMDPELGRSVLVALEKRGYTVALPDDPDAKTIGLPDIIIVQKYDIETAKAIRRRQNPRAALVILQDEPRPNHPEDRIFFTTPNDFSALMLAREIIRFSPTPQPNNNPFRK